MMKWWCAQSLASRLNSLSKCFYKLLYNCSNFFVLIVLNIKYVKGIGIFMTCAYITKTLTKNKLDIYKNKYENGMPTYFKDYNIMNNCIYFIAK